MIYSDYLFEIFKLGKWGVAEEVVLKEDLWGVEEKRVLVAAALWCVSVRCSSAVLGALGCFNFCFRGVGCYCFVVGWFEPPLGLGGVLCVGRLLDWVFLLSYLRSTVRVVLFVLVR
ncbi:transmembrane protein, putative [Medicago truncatula]|uniref:Transmembrane protein, putative n=1 Tax=Medicago truncatula TaxID=3880 RepID=A0A072UWQ1_MEDTR|nr:transmembrane protein, putative [Medicago truncatula]